MEAAGEAREPHKGAASSLTAVANQPHAILASSPQLSFIAVGRSEPIAKVVHGASYVLDLLDRLERDVEQSIRQSINKSLINCELHRHTTLHCTIELLQHEQPTIRTNAHQPTHQHSPYHSTHGTSMTCASHLHHSSHLHRRLYRLSSCLCSARCVLWSPRSASAECACWARVTLSHCLSWAERP